MKIKTIKLVLQGTWLLIEVIEYLVYFTDFRKVISFSLVFHEKRRRLSIKTEDIHGCDEKSPIN